MPVAVVTDSTAYLPAKYAGHVTIVPLTVVVGGRQGREGLEITPAVVALALASRSLTVTTSRPAPAEFIQVYSRLLAAGCSGVLSVHLSARLSGTATAATLAAAEFGAQVEVVDSGSVAMGLGFPALAAAKAAAAGLDLLAVREVAVEARARTTTLFCVETLEHLRRGGRIGAASALLGTALSVKPILRMTSEGIVVGDRVRTSGRALVRLVEMALAAAAPGNAGVESDGGVEIAVHHLAAGDRAEVVRAMLTERLGARLIRCHVTEVGAAVGAHTGPGLLGVVVHRQSPPQSLS